MATENGAVARRFRTALPSELTAGIESAADAARRGELVVVATESVYGLATDAFRQDGLDRIRQLKGMSPAHPLPVVVGSFEAARALTDRLSPSAEALIAAFWPGMLTITAKCHKALSWGVGGADPTLVSLRMPIHEVAWKLARAVGPLALTAALGRDSGGLECAVVEAALGDAVAVYLDSGTRPGGEPSTVVDVTADAPTLARIGALPQDELERVATVALGRPARSG